MNEFERAKGDIRRWIAQDNSLGDDDV